MRLTSPDKVLFPADGLTKADLAAYFGAVAPVMLPHLRERPLSMQRYDRGIGERGVFVQNVPRGAPDWLDRVRTPNRGGGHTEHPVVGDAEGLAWLAQQNTPTVHVWTARRDRLDRPDRLVWDLDPPDASAFEVVRATALALGDVLREAGCVPHAMTSGSKGVHVVVAIRRWAGWDAARAAMRAVAEEVVARDPATRTLEWLKADRGGRLLVDVRTRYGHTVVAPYAVRARDGAPVATPLRWEELEDPALHAQAHTLRSVPARLEALGGDPWAAIAGTAGGPAAHVERRPPGILRAVESLRGRLLIASPRVMDPNFRRTVVLLTEHGDGGAMGLILNRASETTVDEVVPDLVPMADPDDLVYVGGPVAATSVVVLAEFEDPRRAALVVDGDLGFVPADAGDPEDVADNLRRSRVFAGHSGWGPGQLEGELEADDWIVTEVARDDVFCEDVEALWPTVLKRLGRDYALLSTMPEDPSLN